MWKAMMKALLDITSALADEGRVRALLALRGGELCACQLIELLRLAPSTVSKHMALLKQAGLVDARKEGRWTYYRLVGPEAPPVAREAIAWVVGAAGKDDVARADVKRLCCIVQEDPGELCKRQQAERSKCCSSAPATRAAARWRKGGLAT
jgi:DNA-binding transcriptional ArsR family regulator